MTDQKATVKRTEGGKFAPGVSGNPAGRAKGSKNRITLARLLLEEALRDQLTEAGPRLMQQAIRQALKGNDRIMRVLLDKMLMTPRDMDGSEGQDRDVKVVVQNLIKAPESSRPAIQGESVRIPVTIPLPKD